MTEQLKASEEVTDVSGGNAEKDITERDAAQEIESLQKAMEGEVIYNDPIYLMPEDQFKAYYEGGHATNEQVLNYKALKTAQNSGLKDLNEKQVARLFNLKAIGPEQVQAHKKYMTVKHDLKEKGNSYLLMQLSLGVPIEEIQDEMNGLLLPMYEPADLAADALTFGAASAYRLGLKGTAKLGAKQFIQGTAKEVAFGAVAGGAMTVADMATDSAVVTMLSGLFGVAGAQALITTSRVTLKHFLSGIRKNNPEAAKKIVEAADLAPDDELLVFMRQELMEAELEGVRIGERPYIAPKTMTIDEMKAKVERGRVTPGDPKKVASIYQAMRTGTDAHPEQTGGKLIADIERRGNVKAVDLIEQVKKEMIDEIDEARGGKPDPETGTRVPRSQQEKEAEAEWKTMGEWTGERVADMKQVVNWGKDLQADMTRVRKQTRALNRIFAQYTDEIDELIVGVGKTDSFQEELRALEHISLLGKLTQSVYGVRSEWGRGLNAYGMDYKKADFDFTPITADKVVKLANTGARTETKKILKAFKKANTNKLKALRARAVNKGKFMQGVLELEQAALLSHPRSQAVNFFGNLGTLMWRNTALYAATSARAWKEASSWRRPFTRDQMIMAGARYQKEAFKEAIVESLYLPKSHMVDQFKLSRAEKKHITTNIGTAIMETPKVGTVYKALWSGEAQLDSFAKYAEDSKGALPDDFNELIKMFGSERKLPRILNVPIGNIIRLGFHGLTAGDELFKTINYRQALKELAFREILKNKGVITTAEGTQVSYKLSPETIDKAVKAQLENVTEEMHLEAMRTQRRETFTENIPKEGLPGKIGAIFDVDHIGPALKILFVPFWKIAVNLPKYALMNTPLGYLAQANRDIMKAGGPARDELLARWAMGSALAVAGFSAYEMGLVTGRVPPGQRDMWAAEGKQEYSFYNPFTKKYTDYSRFEPFGYVLGIAANMAGAFDTTLAYLNPKEREEAELELWRDVMLSYLVAFTDPLLNKTVFKSVKDVADVVFEPERSDEEKFFVKQVEKFMPRIVDFATEVSGNKEVLREARSVEEAWQKKWGEIGWRNQKAHPKRHLVYGTPLPAPSRTFGLLSSTQLTDDPVLLEMDRVGVNPTRLKDEFTRNKVSVDVSDDPDFIDAVNDHIMVGGLKEALKEMIDDPDYKASTDMKAQKDALQDLITTARKTAIDHVLNQALEIREGRPAEEVRGSKALEQFIEKSQRELDIESGIKSRTNKHKLNTAWEKYLLKGVK